MHRSLYTLLSIFVVTNLLASNPGFGFELALPSPGTDINYNFRTEVPSFTITDSGITAEVLSGELTFAQGRGLRVINKHEDFLFSAYLTLRSPGILDLFDDIFLGFDESLTLFGKDGDALGIGITNTSIGYNPDVRDTYQYCWGFHDPSLSMIYGLKWNITQNLWPGMQLPDYLALDFQVFVGGAIFVVPEPSLSVQALCIGLIGLCCRKNVR